MRKIILATIVIIVMALPAMGDECGALGDTAAMFTKWRNSGKSLQSTIDYIERTYTASNLRTLKPLHIQVARAVYSGNFSPTQNKNILESQCRDARGY